MTVKALASRVSRLVAWVWHHCVWIAALALLTVAGSVIALRYWVLPNIDQYREHIAGEITRATRQRVTIGHMAADWDGLRPRLNLNEIGRAHV